MILFCRLFTTLFLGLFRKPVRVGEESLTNFRVLPLDTEFVSLNAGRYFSFMEIGQWDCNLRQGFLRKAVAEKWWGITVSQFMVYRKPIKLLQRFTVGSRIIGWDEKFFYWENRFYSKDSIASLGYSKVMIRSANGAVLTKEVLEKCLIDWPSPPISSEVLFKLETPNALKIKSSENHLPSQDDSAGSAFVA